MLDFEDVGPLEVSGMSDSRVCTCDKPSLQAVVVAVAVMMVVVGVVGGWGGGGKTSSLRNLCMVQANLCSLQAL